MKHMVKGFVILAALAFIVAACGNGGNEYAPQAINPDTDICEICGMSVADDQYATQIVLKNDRALMFDDLGCLYAWLHDHGEEDVGAAFVRDFHTQEWILLEDATYVFDDEIETPMTYGIISFKEKNAAESYIEDHGFGELLTVADLADHKWEMMNHDHHGHGHDHGDEHDEEHNAH